MLAKTITLESLEKTQRFGVLLGKFALASDVYCLDGDLGAGKTTLTQSIAKGLSVPEKYYITSPSYNIFHEYPGRIPLYHMDFYRLDNEQGVIDIGLDEFFYFSGLTVIEWSCKAQEILPDNRLSLYIKMGEAESRIVDCGSHSDHWQERFDLILLKFYEND